MPSLRTRQALDRAVLKTAEVALSEAAAAVASATETLGEVETTITALETGVLDLDAVTVGGVRFVYDGVGDLVVEP
jgi:hypothetical protein